MRTGLWDLYARCYDVIAQLRPYEEMVGEVVGEVPEGARRVLDAGCGTGNLTRALLSRHPGEIVAADLSPAMLERARRKNPGAVHVLADLDGDLGDLAELDGEFDAIVCGNVLYTLPDPARSMAALKARLTPGGRLVVTTPRAGAGIRPILAAHIRSRGVLSLGRIIGPLLLVGLINARLLHTATYHFLTRDELSRVLGTDDIRATYSDQGWLAVYRNDSGPAQMHGPASETEQP